MGLWFDEDTRERLRNAGYTIEQIPDTNLNSLMSSSREKFGMEFRLNPEDDAFEWKQVERCEFPAHQVAWKPELVENSIGMLDWVDEKLEEWKRIAPFGTRAVITTAEDCAYLLLVYFMRTGRRFLNDFESVCCKNRYSTEWSLSLDTYFVEDRRFMHLHRIHKTNTVGGLLNYLVPYKPIKA